jgi:hypothetical protein
MASVFIHQILNHYTPRESLDPGFLVLDNSANEKPDWFEYWPIRRFLVNEPLDENAFYGFVSPKFKYKTNLSATAALNFVSSQIETTDVVLLSPSIHLTAYHWNVFRFGDSVHPGLLNVADLFFRSIGEPTNLHELVTDSSNEVYSNYMIARPRFWRAWLNVTERLYSIAESPTDPLGARLREPTFYRGSHTVQMKIFIMERIATWILARDSRFTARVRNPFVARSRVYKLPGAIVCDALKIAYVTSGRQERYKELFQIVSRSGRFLTWQVRIGSFFFRPVRSCLKTLSSQWVRAGES